MMDKRKEVWKGKVEWNNKERVKMKEIRKEISTVGSEE